MYPSIRFLRTFMFSLFATVIVVMLNSGTNTGNVRVTYHWAAFKAYVSVVTVDKQ